jgi:subtilase family serine protease/sugar lactone lactonase YvrE
MKDRRSITAWFRNGWTPAALLLLLPVGAAAATLSSVTVKPTAVVNGVNSVATITLSAAAPSGGVTVDLTSQDPAAATVPGSVTVPQGATSAFFVVATGTVSSLSPVTIEASYAGVTRTATLTVTPREPVRGVEGDLWADVILGKPDFSEITPNEVVPYKVMNPGGVFVDRSVSPGRAYVWDSGNSRILGIDLATCYVGASPCSAQIVIGQPSGSDHSACNGDSGFQRYPTRAPASAGSLCGMPEITLSPLEWKSFVTMAGDSQGNLYVPDAFNNRVVKYVSPFATDTVADQVWGQSDFSGNLCNRGAGAPTASTLCFTVGTFSAGGAEVDSAGNLWVADNGNNRVLRFPKNPGTGVIATTADVVLGQPDFVSHDAGTGPATLWAPSSLRFGPDGRLYVAVVADGGTLSRVLVFTPNPNFVSGMAATEFGSQFRAPYGMETDPVGDGLWVNDTSNSMVELWDWNGTTIKKVLGKDTYRPGGDCGFCYSGGGIGVDTAGSVLPSVFVYGQDVYRYSAPIPTPQPGVVYQPDKLFFSPPPGYNFRGKKGLRSGSGVAIYGNQLLAADAGRVVFWNGIDTLTSGKTFDGFVGSPDFNYQFNCCGYIKTDAAGKLWVQGYAEGVYAYQLPLTAGAAPLANILTPGSSLPVLGGGSLTLGSYTDGLVPSPQGGSLWVSDTFNHRVLRIRDPLTSPVVDVVLGQTDPSGNLCNRGLVPPPSSGTTQVATANMLCHPGALSFDRLGNLFLSDHGPEVEGNWRLLRFAGSLFPANNATVLYAVSATKIFPYRGGQPGITFEPAFDSANRMVVGYNSYLGGNFVGIYNDPAGPSTDPDTYLNDFGSWPAAITFDANDNLYVGDSNRSRLLIYHKPLAQFLLTITRTGAGSGTVTSVPAGINCGTACSQAFVSATGVTLTTAPAANSFFAGWSGDADCSDGRVIMSASKTCTARFELLPDLIVSALSVPAGALAGSTISVTDTTRNQTGTGPAGASTTTFYFSVNSTWDASDTPIGSRSVLALLPGGTSSGSSSVTIPAGKATGTYYIIAKADAGGAVTEVSETNNTKAVSIRISPPDLIVSAISVPTTGGAGLSITAANTTKNQANTGPAGASTTKFYLSTNATLDGSDPQIGTQAIGLLAPGASEAHSTSLTIPGGTAPGAYYVIAKADADNLITETIDTNNTAFDAIAIGPDLAVSALSVPPNSGAGQQITVADTTKNLGGGQAPDSTTNFYLSTNAAYSAGDVFLGSRDAGTLGPGATSAGQTTLTIPAGTAVGSYYILAVADGPAAVAETNEANNTLAALIRLSPDLLVTVLSVPASAGVGATFTVNDTTRNQGQGIAAATTTSFYLSPNNTWDTTDTFLQSRPVPLLAYGATSPGSTSVTIPAGTAPGNYFILARADATGAVAETSETNNVLSRAITITP